MVGSLAYFSRPLIRGGYICAQVHLGVWVSGLMGWVLWVVGDLAALAASGLGGHAVHLPEAREDGDANGTRKGAKGRR